MGLFGNNKAQEKANKLAQAALALQQRQNKQSRNQAQRAAGQARRQGARQTAATVAAAQQSAAALAAATGGQPLATEYIDDTSLTRKRLAMGGRSPYGFSMGSGGGLGGMKTKLG